MMVHFFLVLDFLDVGPEKRLSARLSWGGRGGWGYKKKCSESRNFDVFMISGKNYDGQFFLIFDFFSFGSKKKRLSPKKQCLARGDEIRSDGGKSYMDESCGL